MTGGGWSNRGARTQQRRRVLRALSRSGSHMSRVQADRLEGGKATIGTGAVSRTDARGPSWSTLCISAGLCLAAAAATPAHGDVLSACRATEHAVADTSVTPAEISSDDRPDVAAAPATPAALATPAVPAPRRSLVCGNVWVEAGLVSVFETLLEASPTVRRQVASIRATRRLTVSVTLSDTCDVHGAPCHAQTQFARYANGGTIAQVRIRRDTNLADAIGHELEHVREWDEGTLRRVAGLRRDGRDDTDRARLTGERVRDEYAQWLRKQTRSATRQPHLPLGTQATPRASARQQPLPF